MKRLIASLVLLLSPAMAFAAEPDPFDALRDGFMPFVAAVNTTASSVENGMITAPAGSAAKIVKGARVNVLRPSGSYAHPITGEKTSAVNEVVGRAEAVEVSESSSIFRILNGDAKAGDILLFSASPIKVLYYPLSKVAWSHSEEYYYALSEAGRFLIIDIPYGPEDDAAILRAARRNGAEIVVILDEKELEDGSAEVRQRALWAEDGAEMTASGVKVEKGYEKDLKMGDKYFLPNPESPDQQYKTEFKIQMTEAADLDGDGTLELALSDGMNIHFYHEDVILKPAFGGAIFEGKPFEEHIRLEAADANADGKSELFLTVLNRTAVKTYAFGYTDKGFKIIGEWDYFVKSESGILFGQSYSQTGGYKGAVFVVKAEGFGPFAEAPAIPKGMDIYDFAVIRDSSGAPYILAYITGNRIALFGKTGKDIWVSPRDFGGAANVFTPEQKSPLVEPSPWEIKYKIYVSGQTAILVKRVPRSALVPGLGFQDDLLTSLALGDGTLQEAQIISGIKGDILDFAVTDKNIIILSDDWEYANAASSDEIRRNVMTVYPRRGDGFAVKR